MLDDEDYEFIKQEAVHIILKYAIKCIPINGFEIASKMGLSLVSYGSLSLEKLEAVLKISEDGFLIEDNFGKTFIYYNDEKIYTRQNMTILHEIGHYALDHYVGGKISEAEANFFAKYIIAPPPLIHKIRPKSYEDIAVFFEISFEAARNAFNYYQKWLNGYRFYDYKDYEKKLINRYDNVA